jgi:O-acetyl-ADP-ribose deacetylase (regulator of RNase III)
MADQLKVNASTIRLMMGDITDIEIQSFVFYAQHDLKVGSGFGTAISVRGGPTVQEELNRYGTLNTTEVVMSKAGAMKADYIIHAVGPRFQEVDIEGKLKTTVVNTLECAEEKAIEAIAFPPMGTGFYGIPLDVSARVTLETIKDYLSGDTKIKDVVICLQDKREFKPFQAQLSNLTAARERKA